LDSGQPSTYKTIFQHRDLVFSIEYVAFKPNPGTYGHFVSSFELVEPTQPRHIALSVSDAPPPASYGTLVATCCSITDGEYNPFPCNTSGQGCCSNPPCGNCTWWARYKRTGNNEANLYHCTEHANTWDECAATYYPHLLSSTPSAQAVVVYTGPSDNHVAFVEQVYSSTSFRLSEMAWCTHCPYYCRDDDTTNTVFIRYPGSPQVKLYDQANYQGSVVFSEGTGFSNDPNANSYSMEIPGGWSVKTWRGDNRSGEKRCWSQSVPNLQDHGWHLAIQSIGIFDSNVCPSPPTKTPTPTHTPTPTATPTQPVITEWRGEYWNNQTLSGSPALVRNDPEINFHWGDGSPHPAINPDHFSARWTRTLYFAGGDYHFEVHHDDGARLWIDDALVMDQWHEGSEVDALDHHLSVGNHAVRMEMYEIGGGAVALLLWERLATPTPTPTPTQALHLCYLPLIAR